MKSVIDQIRGHRSIRAYSDQPISSEQLDAILYRSATGPEFQFLQAVSIIRITDKVLREQIMHFWPQNSLILLLRLNFCFSVLISIVMYKLYRKQKQALWNSYSSALLMPP